MTWLNVRWRLTLWYGAVLTAIVIGFGSCVYVMVQRHLIVRTDFELDEELTVLGHQGIGSVNQAVYAVRDRQQKQNRRRGFNRVHAGPRWEMTFFGSKS